MLKKLRNILVGWLGAFFIRSLAVTLRYRIRDDLGTPDPKTIPNPSVFVFWHDQLFLIPYLYRRFLPGRRGVCLVSASQDGEMIARVLSRFNLDTVRGSSSRRAREALRSLAQSLKEGFDAGITPDGPRGPRHHAHPGAVGLSSLVNRPIITLRYRLAWKIELPTWDRFAIPIPFSICEVHFGTPCPIDPEADDGQIEEERQRLEKLLDAPW
ncbi:MAG: lysophospholipid acyltransferase family protein [Verrucomicrobiae bacterium]|nr:lysophospholipid acyltransferase family protein [Verrucomicrobiae bacterium]